MKLDVASCIEQLLYEYDSVIIPDLGGVVSTYRSASIDNVQGLLHPPSKSLHFNENLSSNDGVLTNFLAKQNDLSELDAKLAVNNFVRQTLTSLDRREIIVFPGVGRLYKDYEGNLQFLQDSTNFNRDAFGLESVQFYPILRNKETAPSEAPVPMVQERKVSMRRESSVVTFLQSAMPLLAGLALVAFGLTFYLFETEPEYQTFPQRLPVAENRVNKKPIRHEANLGSKEALSSKEANTIVAIDERNGRETSPEDLMSETSSESTASTDKEAFETEIDTKIDTESITLGPNQKEGVIIIGTYNYKSSVQKMVNRIYELGYDVYQKKKPNSRSTRVGIQFVYEDKTELMQILKTARRKIDDRAWVLKR